MESITIKDLYFAAAIVGTLSNESTVLALQDYAVKHNEPWIDTVVARAKDVSVRAFAMRGE